MTHAVSSEASGSSCTHFQWAEDPAHALVCCVRHALELTPVSASTSEGFVLRFYRHGRWPCMFVDVVATVVGVQLRHHYVEYSIDDGSGVIDVMCRGHISLSVAEWSHESGIDACYLPPEPTLLHDEQHFALGDVVHVRGRVYEREDRPRALQAVAISRAADVNDEARHVLEALHVVHVYKSNVPPCDATWMQPASSMPPPPTLPPRKVIPSVPSPFKSHSRRAFTYYVWMYMNAATEHALEHTSGLDVHNVPAFSVVTLARNMAHRAEEVVREKLRKRATQDMAPDILRTHVYGLVNSALQSLVRLGRVIQSGAMYQVAHPHLLACYLMIVLRLSDATGRRATIPRMHMRITSVRQRLQRYHDRFAHVSLASIEAALRVLYVYGKVHAIEDHIVTIDTPTSTS